MVIIIVVIVVVVVIIIAVILLFSFFFGLAIHGRVGKAAVVDNYGFVVEGHPIGVLQIECIEHYLSQRFAIDFIVHS